MLSSMVALWDYRDLVKNLVAKDIKVRYMDAALGFAWALVNPLVTTLMYLVIFTYIFPSGISNYSLYLVTGILHWMFFSQVITQSPELLVANASLIKKIYFPRVLVSISNLLVNLVLWLFAFSVYLGLFPLLGGRFTLALLLYPAYLLLFVLFTFGIGLILSTLYVHFRDIKHIVDVFMQVLFWSAPILYPLDVIGEDVRSYMLISPLVEFTEIFHLIFYDGQLPPADLTFWFSAWTAAVVSVGLWVFYRWTPGLVEDL
jgi:lipopolysaccharide transport system permease protein